LKASFGRPGHSTPGRIEKSFGPGPANTGRYGALNYEAGGLGAFRWTSKSATLKKKRRPCRGAPRARQAAATAPSEPHGGSGDGMRAGGRARLATTAKASSVWGDLRSVRPTSAVRQSARASGYIRRPSAGELSGFSRSKLIHRRAAQGGPFASPAPVFVLRSRQCAPDYPAGPQRLQGRFTP